MSKEIALKNPQFDYSQLSKEDKGKLINYEGQVVRNNKQARQVMMEHGRVMHEVQQMLANYRGGTWLKWLDSMGISKSSAYTAINRYLGFGSIPCWEYLEVTAMDVLTKNPTAKKKALKLVDKGVKVTHAMAQKLLKEHKQPGKPGKPEKPDYGKCPNCAGTKWSDEGEGLACVKCHHPHGEPAGDVDDDRVTTQRQKTVKTVEALLRAFDDLQLLKPNPAHGKAIELCKRLLRSAKEWK